MLLFFFLLFSVYSDGLHAIKSKIRQLLEIQLGLRSGTVRDSAAGPLKKHFFFSQNPLNQWEKGSVVSARGECHSICAEFH